MAIIQCPKCNQSISDQAVKCIHCGEIIAEITCKECGNKFPADLSECPACGFPVSVKPEKESITKKITSAVKKHKKIAIIGSIVLSVVILLSVVIGIAGSTLTPDEQFAYDIAVSLRKTVADRDSFTLYDNIAICRHYDKNGNNDYTYTILEYGATNQYGGISTETVVYKNNEYKCKYSSLDIMTKFDLDQCLEDGGSWLGYKTIIVDAQKIQKKLDADK